MDRLLECAISFQKLCGSDYKIIAQRRDKQIKILLYFSVEQFHHLIGLNKLIDIDSLRGNRTQIFARILDGSTSYSDIQSSPFIKTVNQRMEYFDQLESLLNNDIILKFNRNKAHSLINATMLLYQKQDDVYLHLFLTSKEANSNILIPCSFFPRKDNKYIIHQEVYKVVQIQKIDHPVVHKTLSERIVTARIESEERTSREKMPTREDR